MGKDGPGRGVRAQWSCCHHGAHPSSLPAPARGRRRRGAGHRDPQLLPGECVQHRRRVRGACRRSADPGPLRPGHSPGGAPRRVGDAVGAPHRPPVARAGFRSAGARPDRGAQCQRDVPGGGLRGAPTGPRLGSRGADGRPWGVGTGGVPGAPGRGRGTGVPQGPRGRERRGPGGRPSGVGTDDVPGALGRGRCGVRGGAGVPRRPAVRERPGGAGDGGPFHLGRRLRRRPHRGRTGPRGVHRVPALTASDR